MSEVETLTKVREIKVEQHNVDKISKAKKQADAKQTEDKQNKEEEGQSKSFNITKNFGFDPSLNNTNLANMISSLAQNYSEAQEKICSVVYESSSLFSEASKEAFDSCDEYFEDINEGIDYAAKSYNNYTRVMEDIYGDLNSSTNQLLENQTNLYKQTLNCRNFADFIDLSNRLSKDWINYMLVKPIELNDKSCHYSGKQLQELVDRIHSYAVQQFTRYCEKDEK